MQGHASNHLESNETPHHREEACYGKLANANGKSQLDRSKYPTGGSLGFYIPDTLLYYVDYAHGLKGLLATPRVSLQASSVDGWPNWWEDLEQWVPRL